MGRYFPGLLHLPGGLALAGSRGEGDGVAPCEGGAYGRSRGTIRGRRGPFQAQYLHAELEGTHLQTLPQQTREDAVAPPHQSRTPTLPAPSDSEATGRLLLIYTILPCLHSYWKGSCPQGGGGWGGAQRWPLLEGGGVGVTGGVWRHEGWNEMGRFLERSTMRSFLWTQKCLSELPCIDPSFHFPNQNHPNPLLSLIFPYFPLFFGDPSRSHQVSLVALAILSHPPIIVMNPQQEEESLISHTFRSGKQLLLKFTRFLQATTAPLLLKLDPLLVALSPYYLRLKLFCIENKLALAVSAAVLATYLLVRPKADPEKEKERKKKGAPMVGKRQPAGRTFISDNSEADPQEEPSTGTRREVESSGREAMQPKREKKHLERIESSSEEEESGDKIFFEVYKTYQVSTQK